MVDTTASTTQSHPRKLGLWMCTALVVGNMIGTGIFLLPATLAPLGWNAILGWIFTIIGGLSLACVFAALARTFPQAGGPYIYSREAFGPAVAFMVVWSYWISVWVGIAAIATGAVSYLSVFFPQIGSVTGLHAAVTCLSIWILIGLNCRSTILAGGFQLITTLLKILPLILVIGLGILILGREGSAAIAPLDLKTIELGSITLAATLTLWGLLGLESATVPANRVENPETTIPRATILGVMIASFIYLLVFVTLLLLTPTEIIAGSDAPFADFVGLHMNGNAGTLIAAFAAISGFGALNGWILLAGELPNALARNGVFPKWLADRSAQNTPVRALLFSGVLITIVVFLNYQKSMAELFTFIILLSTTASLVMFLASALAAVKLQWQGHLHAPRLILIIAALASLYAAWTIYGAGGEAVMWGCVLLLAGWPVYMFMRRNIPPEPSR